MAYLDCPECRLTVYSSMLSPASQNCPRCDAKLGAVSRLFRSPMPQRLVGLTKRSPLGRDRIDSGGTRTGI